MFYRTNTIICTFLDVLSTYYWNVTIISTFWSVYVARKTDVIEIADYRSLVHNIVD